MGKIDFKTVYEKGSYYCPANSRYNNTGMVICDRCSRQKLKACLGYEGADMCMQCVAALDNLYAEPQIVLSDTDSDDESILTKMKERRLKMIERSYKRGGGRESTVKKMKAKKYRKRKTKTLTKDKSKSSSEKEENKIKKKGKDSFLKFDLFLIY